jgi:capsid protein
MTKAVTRRAKSIEAKVVANDMLAKAVSEVKRARLREVKNLFDAAAAGRRTASWRTSGLDSNAENWAALAKLRDVARDMVRNNAYARRAKMTIQNNVIGSGIVPRVQHPDQRVVDAVMKHFETTAIHASGQMNL